MFVWSKCFLLWKKNYTKRTLKKSFSPPLHQSPLSKTETNSTSLRVFLEFNSTLQEGSKGHLAELFSNTSKDQRISMNI